MKKRPDLLPEGVDDLEVVQLTAESDVPSSHVYMEAQIFTPDSRRFILHRSAHPHGSDPKDPEHRFLICDVENGCELAPVTDELGTTGPSISPDGEFLYYFVDETEVNGGSLTLKRVKLDGSERETLFVLDGPIPGTSFRISRPYPLSTISSDGERIAISGFLGDGTQAGASFGLLVFDLAAGEVRLPIHGQTWCNFHPQYSRSLETEASHDILIQENHGNVCDEYGSIQGLTGGVGADIHVIRDDGTNLRDMPWGRDGNEFCQGHQCWRGRSERAITTTTTRKPRECQLIEGVAVPHVGHEGINAPGGVRNDLSRSFEGPDFSHFATDIAGNKLISDCGPREGGGRLYVMDLPGSEDGAFESVRFLLNVGSSWQKTTHIHPFLSPDGTKGFFNSDESGVLQAYMVTGWAEGS